MKRLFLDTERFSPFDVTVYGVEKHVSSSELLLATYAIEDGPVHVYEIGEDPDHLLTYIEKADRLIAHNAWYDRNGLEHDGYCARPLSDWHCTMAQALAHSLPGGLDALCRFFNVPEEYRKKGSGKEGIQLFCKPQRDGSRLTKEDLPEKWEEFREYAYFDTLSFRYVFHKMPRLNLHE